MKIKSPAFHPPYISQKSSSDINKYNNFSVGKKNFSSVLRQNSLGIEKLEIDLSEKYNHHAPWWSQTLKSSAFIELHAAAFKDPSTIEIKSLKLTDVLKAISTDNNHLKIKLI